VEVLLEAGAPTCDRSYAALQHAVELRRPDLAALLLRHGASASDVSLCDVIGNGCDTSLIDVLLAAGANLVDEEPIAWGLINCIWPTLKLVKQHVTAAPTLALQVNTALRHHAHEGNAKWVSLTLWAGGDPLARGPYDLGQDWYDEAHPGENAVELAASRGHVEVLQQSKMRTAIRSSAGAGDGLLTEACRSSNCEVIDAVIRAGHSPRTMPDGGSACVERVVDGMVFDVMLDHARLGYYGSGRPNDSSGARSRMGVLHSLLAHGARWQPTSKDAIARVRKSLLKLAPAFSMEFAWLMKRFGAARRGDVRELLTTAAMRRHLSEQKADLTRLVDGIPEVLSTTTQPSAPPTPTPIRPRTAVQAAADAANAADGLSDAEGSHSP
jgi:hypothetical protein